MKKLFVTVFALSLSMGSVFCMEDEFGINELEDVFDKDLSLEQASGLYKKVAQQCGVAVDVSIDREFVKDQMDRLTSILTQERTDSAEVEEAFVELYDEIFTNKYNRPDQKGDLMYLSSSFLKTMDTIESRRGRFTDVIESLRTATQVSYNALVVNQENVLPTNLNFNRSARAIGTVRFALDK